MTEEKTVKERVLEELFPEEAKCCKADYQQLVDEFGKIIDLTEKLVKEGFNKYKGFTAEAWEQQFAQAEMVINDIKKVTSCKSDDGVEILESVENLRADERKKILEDIEKFKTKVKEWYKIRPEIGAEVIEWINELLENLKKKNFNDETM